MNVAKLCLSGDRVDLAHVASLILLLYIVNMQKPCSVLVVFVVGDADAGIPGDYVIVHGQDGRLLEMDPRHL